MVLHLRGTRNMWRTSSAMLRPIPQRSDSGELADRGEVSVLLVRPSRIDQNRCPPYHNARGASRARARGKG